MKVTGFRSHTYEYQLARKLGDANGPLGSDYGRGSILYIDTDVGVTGIAPGGGPVAHRLEHLIVGEDPRGVVGLWKKMQDAIFKSGNAGEDHAAMVHDLTQGGGGPCGCGTVFMIKE